MAGIYLHIPFCKTRCIYCDFYSTTRAESIMRYAEALCRELGNRCNYLKEPVETIYFGGGTPSQLPEEAFRKIFRTIEDNYGLKNCREITIEANPDDLTKDYTDMLKAFPFNRISIGIQTFNDHILQQLRRRHTARQAIESVERCRQSGFDNISIDLMYGLPNETVDTWTNDLRQAISLAPEHISAYHLIYEEGTALWKMREEGKARETDEEESLAFFNLLTNKLLHAGYEHYEISNFCRPGFHSRHNSSYWKGIPYLGCGAAAHSFDGHEHRQWNVSSLDTYIKGIEEGGQIAEQEHLDLTTRYNEFVITSLRTAWGLPLQQVEERFGQELYQHCLACARPYINSGKLLIKNNRLHIAHDSLFVSDGIMSDLLKV